MQRPHFHVGQPVQLFLSMRLPNGLAIRLPDRSFKTKGPLAAVVTGDNGDGTYTVIYYGRALLHEVGFAVGTDPTKDVYIQPVPPIDYGPQDPAQR